MKAVGDHAGTIGKGPGRVHIRVVAPVPIISAIAIVTRIAKEKAKRRSIKIGIYVIRIVVRIGRRRGVRVPRGSAR